MFTDSIIKCILTRTSSSLPALNLYTKKKKKISLTRPSKMRFYLKNEKDVPNFGTKPKILRIFIQKDFTLDYWNQIWTKNPNINILRIDIGDIYDGIENLFTALSICQIQVKKLYIGNQGLDEYDGKVIASFIKDNDSLTNLNLQKNSLGTASFKIIQALNGKKNIKYLNLSDNDISSKNILSLREIKCGLKTLVLDNNNIKCTKGIKEFLSKNSLSKLNLSKNEISDIQPLIDGILKSQANDVCRLEYLNLSGNIFKKLPVSITNLQTVTNFFYVNEELATIPQEVAAWLDTYKQLNVRFWNDFQNTHDSTLLLTVKNSLQKIKSTTTTLLAIEEDPELIKEIKESNLDDDVKLHLLNFKSEKHSSINFSYQQVVHIIFSRIATYEEEKKNNVLEVVNDEVKVGIGLCLTGQICRLVNSLNTFDECVKVSHIDLTECFMQTGMKLLREETYTTERHKYAFESYLEEHSISLNTSKKEEFYNSISIFEEVYGDIIQEEISNNRKRKREDDDHEDEEEDEDDEEEKITNPQKKQKK